MDLAYVDRLAHDKNVVKYLLVRQELFDWTVDAEGMKRKDSTKTVRAFWLNLHKRIDPQKFGSTRERNLPDSLKIFAKLKEYKLTLQWVWLRLHLLNVQYDPWKNYLTVTSSNIVKSKLTISFNSFQPWITEKIAR